MSGSEPVPGPLPGLLGHRPRARPAVTARISSRNVEVDIVQIRSEVRGLDCFAQTAVARQTDIVRVGRLGYHQSSGEGAVAGEGGIERTCVGVVAGDVTVRL